ncbi:MAG: hypothetical protein SO314_00640, partial [Alphaproteobacteria bacterium]|nr:hypothetical protein [Alphaproteobacteria bacterium]
CSPGQLYKGSKLCQWDSSYGTCCTASPSAGCPSNYSVNCYASRGSSGYDEVYVGSTECGSSCYGCEKHYHSYSCPYGYSSSSSSCNYGYDTASKSCSCGVTSGTCYKCKAKPAHDPDDCKPGTETSKITACAGWCDTHWNGNPTQYIRSSRKYYCTTYSGTTKETNETFFDCSSTGYKDYNACTAARTSMSSPCC